MQNLIKQMQLAGRVQTKSPVTLITGKDTLKPETKCGYLYLVPLDRKI
jgi:hypothetical protein